MPTPTRIATAAGVVRPGTRASSGPVTQAHVDADPDPLGFDRPTPANLGNSEVEPTFTRGPARRPAPQLADPLLQWSTGLPTRDRQIYAGWLLEAERRQDLDEAMHEAGFSLVTIKHGSGNMVTHWAVETANLFVITEGVQTIAEMKHTDERYGIAFGWRRLDDGRQQSVLRCRCFLRELLEVGFTEPLLITVKSTLTGDLITALSRQYEVLDAIDAFRAQDQKPALQPPLYACSIPLGPGPEVARGSGGQTREIAPIVAQIPKEITREYVRSHWIKRDWTGLVEGLLDATVAWSVQASRQIASGVEEGNGASEDGGNWRE